LGDQVGADEKASIEHAINALKEALKAMIRQTLKLKPMT